jgi:hypothetical protein
MGVEIHRKPGVCLTTKFDLRFQSITPHAGQS